MRMTANDWQLYTCSMKCGAAARALTKELNRLLKNAQCEILKNPEKRVSAAKQVRKEMFKFMDGYSKYGACDTEPEWACVDMINKVLGTEIVRWD